MAYSLGELAVRFGLTLHGDPETRVTHVGSLSTAGDGALTFIAHTKLADQKGSILGPLFGRSWQVNPSRGLGTAQGPSKRGPKKGSKMGSQARVGVPKRVISGDIGQKRSFWPFWPFWGFWVILGSRGGQSGSMADQIWVKMANMVQMAKMAQNDPFWPLMAWDRGKWPF